MATMTDFADRTSSGENVTVTLTPAVGDNYEFNAFYETGPFNTISVVEWSANAGTNFFNPASRFVTSAQLGIRTGLLPTGVLDTPIVIHLNNGSRFRYTTPANVGTYIISSIGFIVAT